MLPNHRDEIHCFLKKYGICCMRKDFKPFKKGNRPNLRVKSSSEVGTDLPKKSAYDLGKPLIKKQEELFLSHYGREIFNDMVQCESKSRFASLMTNQVYIT